MNLLHMCAWISVNNLARDNTTISCNYSIIVSCLLIEAILEIAEATKLSEETYNVNRLAFVL